MIRRIVGRLLHTNIYARWNLPRTKGAKGKPKDPDKELERVKQLYADQGKPFPYDQQPAPADPAQPEQQTDKAQDVEVTIGTHKDKTAFQCGACGEYMDKAYGSCPKCGVSLTWQI